MKHDSAGLHGAIIREMLLFLVVLAMSLGCLISNLVISSNLVAVLGLAGVFGCLGYPMIKTLYL